MDRDEQRKVAEESQARRGVWRGEPGEERSEERSEERMYDR